MMKEDEQRLSFMKKAKPSVHNSTGNIDDYTGRQSQATRHGTQGYNS